MVDCTPTWFEIREQVEHNTYLTTDEVDRWLAEHDAKVRAEEREKAARIVERYVAPREPILTDRADIAARIRAGKEQGS